MTNFNEDDYKRIFSKNLNKIMELNNKTQVDLINDLGFNKSAVSTWCNGSRLPRMDKVDMLCSYFKVKRTDLLEDNKFAKQPNTIQENEIVTNFRMLDEKDKPIIVEFVKNLSSYSDEDKKRLTRYMAYLTKMQNMENELMAAHNDNATDDEELEKIKKDFDKF